VFLFQFHKQRRKYLCRICSDKKQKKNVREVCVGNSKEGNICLIVWNRLVCEYFVWEAEKSIF